MTSTVAGRVPVSPELDLHQLLDPGMGLAELGAALAATRRRHITRRHRYLGYPVFDDVFTADGCGDGPVSLTERYLRGRLFNNIGDETCPHPGGQHGMEIEKTLLDVLCRLFGIPADDRWGHVTNGGSESNRTAIWHALDRLPHATIVHSAAAHYSIPDAAATFRTPARRVAVLPGGAMNLDDLDEQAGRLVAGRPRSTVEVIVVATWGTTKTGADDDLAGITAVLDAHHISRRHLHVDAALHAIPIAVDGRAGDLTHADTICTSGYKFLATPEPSSVLIGRRHGRPLPGDKITYTGTYARTETGVRSAVPASYMLESLIHCGFDGHRTRAHNARALAARTVTDLNAMNVPAWRNPHADFHIVLPQPPPPVRQKWTLAAHGDGWCHIIVRPNAHAQLAEFLTDLDAALPTRARRRNLFVPLAARRAR